jgi:hypothetical protein
MAEFLASVRRHAGVSDRAESRDAFALNMKRTVSVGGSSSDIGHGGKGDIRRDGRSPSSFDTAYDGVGNTGGGVRFCSQRHRRWLGGSHERALDGRRGCWTGVSMRELRDEHIEFGLHYAPTDVSPDAVHSRVTGGGDLNSDLHGESMSRGHSGCSTDADTSFIDGEVKVHEEDEAATHVAWRLRAYRVMQQKSRADWIRQSPRTVTV